MTTTDLPEWIYPGAKVAAVGNGMAGSDIFVTTVERITVTKIVCEGDRRFQRRAPHQLVGTGNYALEPLGNLRVQGMLAQKRLRSLATRVDKIAGQSGTDTYEVLVALDLIEKVVASTRAAVEKLSKEN